MIEFGCFMDVLCFFVISAEFAQQELSKLVRVPLAEQALAAPELWQLVAKELKQI